MNTKPKVALVTTIVVALAIAGALGYTTLTASANTGTGLLASPASTTTNSIITSSIPMQYGSPDGPWNGGPGYGNPGIYQQNAVNLNVGQKITVTSTSGLYYSVTDRTVNGTASGTFTFIVTGKLSTGYVLSISSGTLTINGFTYTVSSGSAQMTLSANSISGQGTTSSSGIFTIQAMAHGSFVGSTTSATVDFSNGTTEYNVFLSGLA
ncbi:MAG: hypothetical protein JRN20_03930 [Nitrososphaerota archaeon]|jgi:hypothetical protein|nr:hypothetical protein [Nitrososphaerota archaeon]MDG6922054.1 hypothetical protein [Nitrososphaerota archaeon]